MAGRCKSAGCRLRQKCTARGQYGVYGADFRRGRSLLAGKRVADAALGPEFFYRRFEAGRESASQPLQLVSSSGPNIVRTKSHQTPRTPRVDISRT